MGCSQGIHFPQRSWKSVHGGKLYTLAYPEQIAVKLLTFWYDGRKQLVRKLLCQPEDDRSLSSFSYTRRRQTKNLCLYRRIPQYQKSTKTVRALKSDSVAFALESETSKKVLLNKLSEKELYALDQLLRLYNLLLIETRSCGSQMNGVNYKHN